jgi:phosphate transport system protein
VRDSFASELIQLENGVEDALNHAPAALAAISELFACPRPDTTDPTISAARQLRRCCRAADVDLIVVTARQAPVAGDLRLVLALIQLARHGTLIANQFGLIGQQLAGINRDGAVHDRQPADHLSRMALLASTQLADAMRAFTSRDLTLASEIDRADDAIDWLNRQVFQATMAESASLEQRELAMRHMLIARSLERIGDNAVDIAEQCPFLISAELREFTDASRPAARGLVGRA